MFNESFKTLYIYSVMFKNIAVIVTFFSLWLSGYFTQPSQQILAFALIFSVGILHGSNDLAIISKWKRGSGKNRRYYFFATYILTVIGASVLFYVLPIIALVVFILLSAYHFGEQHWVNLDWSKRNTNPFYLTAYGLSILLMLFYLNMDETAQVINSLTGFSPGSTYVLSGFILTLAAWLIPAVYDAISVPNLRSKLFYELFLLLVFAIVFKTATLIWAFAIYFIYWHSVPSILEQLRYLYNDISWASLRLYFRSAGMIWLISLLSLTAIYFLIRDDEQIFIPLFFAFLGAITFAHTVIMSKMFQSDKK